MKNQTISIEFEDLDAGGVVYHANYICLCERARNRWLALHEVTFAKLKMMDVALAVRAINAEYFLPLLEEPVNIFMKIISNTEKSITISHEIFPVSSTRKIPHFRAEITLVSANYSTGRACPLPEIVTKFVEMYASNSVTDTP